MPCYTVTTQSIELGKLNYALLEEALGVMGAKNITRYGELKVVFDLGYQTYAIEGGKLTSTAYDLDQVKARIKQSISRVVVNKAAKRMGWMVSESAPNKLHVKRRY